MFVIDYTHMLQSKIEIDPASAINSFESLLSCIKQTPHKLYLFIDEYDNFANELMARRKEDKYFDQKANIQPYIGYLCFDFYPDSRVWIYRRLILT